MSPQDDHEHEHARMSDEGCPNHPADYEELRCALCGLTASEHRQLPNLEFQKHA